MIKVTGVQRKQMARLRAWLEEQPFRENARDKDLKVPAFTTQEVLEQFIPPDITGAGQFFTPLQMGAAALAPLRLAHFKPHKKQPPFRVADFCAGIGHLLYHFQPLQEKLIFDAWEMEELCVRVGCKLFSWVNWHHQIPFFALNKIEGQYDLVVGNPPIGTTRGMMRGREMCENRCRRSEHVFLELTVRVLKPGRGQAIVLAPHNYIDTLPQAARNWFDARARVEKSWGHLPGKFSFTREQLHAWHFVRLSDPAPDETKETKFPKKVASSAARSPPSTSPGCSSKNEQPSNSNKTRKIQVQRSPSHRLKWMSLVNPDQARG